MTTLETLVYLLFAYVAVCTLVVGWFLAVVLRRTEKVDELVRSIRRHFGWKL